MQNQSLRIIFQFFVTIFSIGDLKMMHDTINLLLEVGKSIKWCTNSRFPLKTRLVKSTYLISTGLAPLLILSKPSFAIVRARTVAVVVPSPASSLVLLATSWTNLAPMFWNLSFSSTAFATVTPSLVILGLPQLCSMITFRPCHRITNNLPLVADSIN